MREYLYYPGCSLKGMARAYDESLQSVFNCLGLKLHELDDWNCCGATYYMSIDETLAFGLSSRNLCLAEKSGLDVVIPCSACYLGLLKTKKVLENGGALKDKVLKGLSAAGLEYKGTVKIRHPLEVLSTDVGLDTISEHVTSRLTGVAVAPYYGCQIVRPFPEFDDLLYPISMDKMMKSLGAKVVEYGCKTRCCGGSLTGTIEDVGLRLNYILLHEAERNGGNCIATVCPLCHFNLESYQKKINKEFGSNFNLPILYFTQVLGAAFGIPHADLGMNKSLISPEPLFATA